MVLTSGLVILYMNRLFSKPSAGDGAFFRLYQRERSDIYSLVPLMPREHIITKLEENIFIQMFQH